MEREKCQICGRRALFLRECILCGKQVCPRCFRVAMGVCKGCMPGKEKGYYELLEKYGG